MIFNTADGNGPFRRIYFTAGCQQLLQILTGEPAACSRRRRRAVTRSGSCRSRSRGIITGVGTLFAPGGACAP